MSIQPEIIVGVLSLCGTLIGSIAGIMTSNKMTAYRIAQLEKKVDKHNSVVERVAVIENEIAEIQKDISDLEDK